MVELLKEIFSAVKETTETPYNDLISHSKRSEVVLARRLFVEICIQYGFPTSKIAAALHKTDRSIRQLYSVHIKAEKQKIYGVYAAKIKKILGTKNLCTAVH